MTSYNLTFATLISLEVGARVPANRAVWQRCLAAKCG